MESSGRTFAVPEAELREIQDQSFRPPKFFIGSSASPAQSPAT
jgi:hypothetical protein